MIIALFGYGKMGKAIERIAQERGHMIALRIDLENRHTIRPEELKACDIAIDFSTPDSAVENYKWCFDIGVPIVSGTTGWLEHWDEVLEYCREKSGGFFYASNFSIGVNIFFRLNRELAKMMNHFNQYRVSIEEIHHIHKLDAPSGTAITLAEGLVENLDRYKGWYLNEKGETPEGKVPVKAIREGEVPGTHHITYKSDIDSLEIGHTAFSRDGFALGAVVAAEFMKERRGVYGMEDLMKFE